MKEILPTQYNLAKRIILNNEICQRCYASVEDVCHSLVDCKYARNIWKLKPCFSWFESSVYMPFSCFAKKEAERLSREEFVLFIGMAWSIWKSRNKVLYGNSREDWHQVLNRAEILLESIKVGAPSQSISSKTIATQPDIWCPPEPS